MNVDTAEKAPARSAVKAGLLAGGVFLLVFVFLSLLLLNLATPWIERAETVRAAASRLLWMVVPVLVIDAAAALLAAFLGGRSALSRGCTGPIVVAVSVAPPLVVALALAAAGASDPAQTVYDLLAVTVGCWTGVLLALRGDTTRSSE